MILNYEAYSEKDIREYYPNLLDTLKAELGLTDEQALTAVQIVAGICRNCLNEGPECCCSPAYDE